MTRLETHKKQIETEIDRRCEKEQALRLRSMYDTAFMIKMNSRALLCSMAWISLPSLLILIGGVGELDKLDSDGRHLLSFPHSGTLLIVGIATFIAMVLILRSTIPCIDQNWERGQTLLKKMSSQLQNAKEDFAVLTAIDPSIESTVQEALPELFPPPDEVPWRESPHPI